MPGAVEAPPLAAVLFDLDGTLLDTAPDLAAALNRLRARHGLPPLPYELIRPHASHGSFAMMRLGFDLPDDHPEFEPRRLALLDLYRAHIAESTQPFEGIDSLLDGLIDAGLAWGIVTNKPAWLTEPLLAQVGLTRVPGCVVSGDTLPERKPHPAPLLHAARLLGVSPDTCLYVGDAARDIEAGRHAGMRTIIARYGYLSTADDPEQWGADAVVDTPQMLASWIAGALGQRMPPSA